VSDRLCGMTGLEDRYANEILGVLSCFDRVVVTGVLPDIAHKDAMEHHLWRQGLSSLDLPRYFEPMKAELVAHAEAIAREHGLTVEYIARKNFRKDERIKEILAARGEEPGLVHIFSGIEPCNTFRAGTRKDTGRIFLAPRQGKCLHYYFYFIDAEFGLCYLRVPTWAPFRLQFYFNGHNWLARRLAAEGIPFELIENVFVQIGDFGRAQALVDSFSESRLHQKLDELARRFCPVLHHFAAGYYWSLMQLEHATDIVFRSREALAHLYDHLVRTVVVAAKTEHVSRFLGRRLHPAYQGELGSRLSTRIEGTCVNHHMGQASIKMYDKLGRVLRIETTASDVTFFRAHREVEHRDGSRSMKTAPVKKTIYSLGMLRTLMLAANVRYLEFLANLDDPSDGSRHLLKLAEPVREHERSYKGLNLCAGPDLGILLALARGELHIHGLRNKHLQAVLGKAGRQVSRILKRLRLLGLLKTVAHTYKYYLTRLGKAVISAALQVREFVVIPALSFHATATT
jgi:hypothetical protein